MNTSPAPEPQTSETLNKAADFAPLRAHAGAAPEKTLGEHGHRFIQNILVNHVANLGVSFWFAHAATFGGKSRLGNAIKHLNDKANRITDRYPSLSIPKSIFWLSTGGTILMPVVRWLDETDVKLSIVKRLDSWADRLRGQTPDAEKHASREAAYARIEREKPPSWPRTLVARFSGIIFNFATEIALQKAHRKLMPVPGADPKEDYGYGWFGRKVEDDLRTSGKLSGDNAEQRIWWARNIPLEVLSTINAVAFYNTVYRWFQKDAQKKSEAAEQASPPANAILADDRPAVRQPPVPVARIHLQKRETSHAAQTLRERADSPSQHAL